MRHWRSGDEPQLPGVRVLGLTHAGRVYAEERRALGPPLRFGVAVAGHLAGRGTRYDVVHSASFPYFPLLAAALLRRRGGYRMFVDWHEVWGREYWWRYAGPLIGTAGWLVQRACVRTRHTAFCFSRLNARRLVAEGSPHEPIVLPGLYAGPADPVASEDVHPELVVYAGRHVREKRLDALVRGFARARARRPGLELELYGDGQERWRIAVLVHELGLEGCVRMPGKVGEVELDGALARAGCLATASEREGYGLVVVEAAAHGTPSVIVRGPENAAMELVRGGVNGAIAASDAPEDIARAILEVVEAGRTLRDSTARWFAENANSLRIERSLDLVLAHYADSAVA
jgi:glycosyltransferase involved in cell wall biosynthesis